MPSPLDADPYDVLGVDPGASEEELRKAFRRALRQTHPDTGGDPQRFTAVQRAWERVGTPLARRAYDAGVRPDPEQSFAPRAPRPRQDSRPTTRTYGHPGGWRRERYLELLREWVGRGVEIDDPYDSRLIRSAPREIRHMLADALAEEASAKALSTLGIGFTVWHDVAAPGGGKIDHIVLGPTGLFAVQSEDFGGPVKTRRGELIGEAVGGTKPFHDLATRTRSLARAARVKFTGVVIVVPDDAAPERLEHLGSHRGMVATLVRSSALLSVLRDGVPQGRAMPGNELFDVRTRLQSAITFV